MYPRMRNNAGTLATISVFDGQPNEMALTSYAIHFLQLSALLFAIEHFPDGTPKRWSVISEYLQQYAAFHNCREKESILDPLVVNCFPSGSHGKKLKIEFDGSIEVRCHYSKSLS